MNIPASWGFPSMHQPEIKKNAEVTHPIFGLGKVLERYGEDEKSKVIVKFREEGEKKLSLAFAKLEAKVVLPVESDEESTDDDSEDAPAATKASKDEEE